MGKLYQPGKKQITKTIRDAFFGLLLLVLYLSSYFLLWQSTTYLLLCVCTMYLYYPCFLSHFLWSPTFYHFSYFYYFFFIHISNSNFGDARNNASEQICMYRVWFWRKKALVDYHEFEFIKDSTKLWKKVFFIVLMKIKILSSTSKLEVPTL